MSIDNDKIKVVHFLNPEKFRAVFSFSCAVETKQLTLQFHTYEYILDLLLTSI